MPRRPSGRSCYGPGDLWFFPKGHAHAISTLGDAPCHALLTFDDGLFSERGTFGISGWVSREDAGTLALNFGVPTASVAAFPQGESYINQGEVIALDSEAARAVNELPPARSHHFRLMAESGTLHLASAREFPMSATMTGLIIRLPRDSLRSLDKNT
jgi:oxalate decarboxylase